MWKKLTMGFVQMITQLIGVEKKKKQFRESQLAKLSIFIKYWMTPESLTDPKVVN